MTQSHLPRTGRGVVEAVIDMLRIRGIGLTCLFEWKAGFLFATGIFQEYE